MTATPNPNRLAGSSCDQAADDMLGTAPTPSRATSYLPRIGARQASDIQGGARLQLHGPLRMTDMPSGRRDLRNRTVYFGCLAEVSRASCGGKFAPSLDGASGRFGRFARLMRVDTHPSIAICCSDPSKFQTHHRTADNCDVSLSLGGDLPSTNDPCIGKSKIFDARAYPAWLRRKTRISVVRPSAGNTIFLTGEI